MGKLTLQTGDVFASDSGAVLGTLINLIQRCRSSDNRSEYHHAGIVVNSGGKTLEALWTVKNGDLCADYYGARILVARPLGVWPKDVAWAISCLEQEHLGQVYPFWRMGFHLLGTFFAKFGLVERLVCSELVGKYLYRIGLRHEQYRGTTPDMLVDEWRKWRDFDVIFEGRLSDRPSLP